MALKKIVNLSNIAYFRTTDYHHKSSIFFTTQTLYSGMIVREHSAGSAERFGPNDLIFALKVVLTFIQVK